MKKLKSLIFKACGENRNMSDFAREISSKYEVSQATLYRYASGDIRRINYELLTAIADFSEGRVTYEELALAAENAVADSMVVYIDTDALETVLNHIRDLQISEDEQIEVYRALSKMRCDALERELFSRKRGR